MKPWRQWIGVGLALGIIGALAPHFLESRPTSLELREVRAQPATWAAPAGAAQPGAMEQSQLLVQRPPAALGMQATLGQLGEQPGPPPVEVAPAQNEPDLRGLDLLRLEIAPDRVTSPLPGGRTAELTLDPDLERATLGVFRRYGVPEAGAILMDVRTGNLLVYASQVTNRVPFDVNLRAEAPSASVFKLITTAALLETHAVHADTEQCYHGGQSRIRAEELRDNPARDQACSTLANALGHSLNVVFARLAQRHLTPERLSRMARAFGFGSATPFDVPSEAPELDIPSDPLEFARTAAGFWHTSLSPLAAVSIAATVANHGVLLRPRIVRAVSGEGFEWHARREPIELRRVMPEANARELGEMMLQTVLNGSASRAFHERGRAYLGEVRVAGKTGTLARQEQNRFYTWFVGFAPQDKPEVAVATLIVNTPVWRIKAAQLARDVLRAYFAKHGQPGVSPP